jgi:hypothetical protein
LKTLIDTFSKQFSDLTTSYNAPIYIFHNIFYIYYKKTIYYQ